MLSRAGRLAGACLRPALGPHGRPGHTHPAVPRLAVSGRLAPPASLLFLRPGRRNGSSKAKDHATRDRVKRVKHEGDQRPSTAEDIGRLVKAGHLPNPEYLALEFDKLDAPVTVAKLWLRDVCQCPLCVSESSGQKRFATCDLPSAPGVDSMRVLEDGGLEVSWANDNDLAPGAGRHGHHVSTYPLAVLHDTLLATVPYRRLSSAREAWDSARFDEDARSREISYAHWMQDGPRFAEAFRDLHRWGLVVVRGVPRAQDAVEHVASRLGHLQATLYGPTWDVVSKPMAENVAYTNEFLCLHQDLMYLREPPRIQVLHCLENGCEGGDSLFSDGLRAAHDLRLNSPTSYGLLAASPVDFHYARGGHYWHNHHKTINVHPTRRHEVVDVRWSPPFQAPFWTALREGTSVSPFGRAAGSVVGKWHEAARVFRDSIEDPASMVQFRLQPGDCVVFDNWRVLHGRRAFDTGSGRRHLRGTYVENQAFNSTWIRLQREGLMFPEQRAYKAEEAEKARRILKAWGRS